MSVHTRVMVAATVAAALAGIVAAGPTGQASTPPSSSPPESTAPDSSAPGSSVPGSSVPVDPIAAGEAAAADAATQAWAAWTAALISPDDEETSAALDVWFWTPDGQPGPAREVVDASIQAQRDSGTTLGPHPTVESTLTVEQVEIIDPAYIEFATATVCAVGAFEVVAPPAGSAAPDSSEPVVTERLNAARETWELQYISDERWVVREITPVEQFDGQTTCPPPPPPTTTTTLPDPLEAERQAVAAAAEGAHAARNTALQALGDAASMAAVDQYFVAGSPARLEIDGSLRTLTAEGWRTREHTSIPATITIEQISLRDEPPTRADVTACIIDSGVVYEPATADGGAELIVNDLVIAGRVTYEMQNVDGVWRLANVSNIQDWIGATECPAAS